MQRLVQHLKPGVTYKQLIGYINLREKIRYLFSRVLLWLFSGPEIPVEHRILCDKIGLFLISFFSFSKIRDIDVRAFVFGSLFSALSI